MKKLLPLLVLPLLTIAVYADPPEDVLRPYASKSEGHWFTQLDIGLNWSFLNTGDNTMRTLLTAIEGDDTKDYLQSANGLAPLISASIGYAFNDMFGLRFGAAYDSRSVSRTETTVDLCDMGVALVDERIDKDYTVRADYLSLSLLWDIYIDDFMVYLGPSASIPLSMNIEETFTVSDPESDCAYFPGGIDESPTVSAELSDNELMESRFSFKLGIGYMMPIGTTTDVVFQLGYDIGLTNLLSEPGIMTFRNPEFDYDAHPDPLPGLPVAVSDVMKVSSLQATVGIRFNL